MPSLTYDRFDVGLDRRKGASVADANRLRELKNAYVTQGRAIRKRPGLKRIATLETGTKGLVAAFGKLNTFYNAGSVTHANTLFQANMAKHSTSITEGIARVHYGGVFLGYIYLSIEYNDLSVEHIYLDNPGAWAATTAYSLTNFRRPTVANGYRYECTTAGTSAGSEPTWPTTPGGTVVDGTVTWTCRSFKVVDANCPHSKGVIRAASRIFAIDGETVPFSAAGDPRDWTTASDAGFLPVGLQQEGGATDAMALGQFQKQLVVFFSDSAQIWTVDVDPANNAIYQRIYGVGTRWARSHASFATDVFFLAYPGFRSITVNSQTENMQDTDVGSPIDSLVAPVSDSATPMGLYVPGLGQYWCVLGNRAWVYSFSRSAKIAAWSEYEFAVTIDDAATLENKLYVRSGDSVFEVTHDVFTDDGQVFEALVELPYVDAKRPGVMKQYTGCDMVVAGTVNVSFKYDASDEGLVTSEIEYNSDTRPGPMIPIEVCATSIAPRLRHSANEDFQLDLISIYHEELGTT